MARTVEFGRSGSGKSWYLGCCLEDIVPQFSLAVHFDIEDEEQGLSRQEDGVFTSFYLDEEFFNTVVEYEGREMPMLQAVILKNRHVRVVPDGLTRNEMREAFAQICHLAMDVTDNGNDVNFHVSADEAHQVLPDVGDDLDQRIVRMLTGGRKQGVEYWFATQRPANLHEEAFSQANYGVYFSLTKDVDIGKVNGSCGFNAYTELPKLDKREFILEDLDSGELRKQSSENMERQRPHIADDDGVADDVLMDSASGGEDLRAGGEV